MKVVEFDSKVREFPFLGNIFAQEKLSAISIGGIRIERADRNLLEVTPITTFHDSGMGEHSKSRLFWLIAPGETRALKTASARPIAPIGTQLLALNRQVLFLVEIHAEYWDFDSEENKLPDVVLYKVLDFDWRKHCQPARPKQYSDIDLWG